jgi:hypothetical protein
LIEEGQTPVFMRVAPISSLVLVPLWSPPIRQGWSKRRVRGCMRGKSFTLLVPAVRPLANIGNASRTMNKDSELFVRGVLDLGKRRKPQSFAADAASLWILNPNMLIVNELYLYNAKPRWRTYSIQCCLSMAQFSVRGACGFVLTGDTDISAIEWGSVRIGDPTGTRVLAFV